MSFSQLPPATQQPAPAPVPPVQPSPQVMQSIWQYQQYPYQPVWDPYAWRRQQRAKHLADFKRIGKQYGAICILSLFIYLTIALVVLLHTSSDIFEGLLQSSGSIYIILPTPTAILTISGGAFVIYYLFLAVALVISYIFMMGSSAKTFAKELIFGKPAKHSPLYTVGGLFCAVLVITKIWYSFANIIHANPTVPNFSDNVPFWEVAFGYAQASVWEEIVSRLLLIGVSLLWIDLIFRRNKLQTPYRYFIGGKLNFGPVECGLIVFSALMFGFAHLEIWDFWKVPPAFIVGLAFGYLFVRFGIYAAIMLHFSLNFLSIPIDYFNPSLGVEFIIALMIWACLAAGVMFLVYYSLRLWKFITQSVAQKKNDATQGPGQFGPTGTNQ